MTEKELTCDIFLLWLLVDGIKFLVNVSRLLVLDLLVSN